MNCASTIVDKNTLKVYYAVTLSQIRDTYVGLGAPNKDYLRRSYSHEYRSLRPVS
jgi:hypothetical protein